MTDESLLHPPAEVVRTGLPISTDTPTASGPKDLVAGPFATYKPPSASALPPGAAPPKPVNILTLEIKDPSAKPINSIIAPFVAEQAEKASAAADEQAYLSISPNPDASLGQLGPQRGGKKPYKRAILWEIVRSLRLPCPTDENPNDQGDLPLLSTSLPSPKQNITQIRHSHHQLAQMLATGTDQSECALITGYSPVYISILKGDPTFKDLVSYYAAQREHIYVDAIERMRSLGLSTLDELQSRLEEDPTQFSIRELHEQAEIMLIKPMAATRGVIHPSNAPSNAGVQVNVNFVQTPPRTDDPKQPDIIDMKPVAKY
jgi:hypothetical protein